MTDLEGAAAIENDPASQKLIADQQAEAAAGNVDGAAEGAAYPREFNAHSPWVDDNVSPPVEFVGTQYGYDTKAEALALIDAKRAAGKQVFYMDPGNASYVLEETPGDWRVTVED